MGIIKTTNTPRSTKPLVRKAKPKSKRSKELARMASKIGKREEY